MLDKDFRADDIIGEIEIPIDPGAHRHKRRRPPGHGSMNVVSEDHVELVPTQQFPLVREGGRHVKSGAVGSRRSRINSYIIIYVYFRGVYYPSLIIGQ